MKTLVIFCLFSIFLYLERCYSQTTKPNIVIIIADDVGWNDVGLHGSNQIPTPNIDALAYNGIILNRFYTHQSCTPSRTSLLTGQYPIRTGMQGLPLSIGDIRTLPADVPLLPERLKPLGYNTHLVGKWHLGASCKNVTPTRRGFDSHFGYWSGDIRYFNHTAKDFDGVEGFDLHDNLESAWSEQGQYTTTLFTKKAVEIIKNNNDHPLFLLLGHLAAHSTLEVPDINNTNAKFHYIPDMNRRLYADMVYQLDKSVGEVMTALAEKGILNNTIVVYLSDNGADTIGPSPNFGSNWPLRGMKSTLYEGGVRNTAVVYNSRFTTKGIITNELMHLTDLLPTLYDAAGGNLQTLGKIDGVNQWETLTESKNTTRTELLIHIDEQCGASAIIDHSGRYKLVNDSCSLPAYRNHLGESGRTKDNPPYNITEILRSKTNTAIQNISATDISEAKILNLREQLDLKSCRNTTIVYNVTCENLCLFDLDADPCETTDISAENPEIVLKMSAKLLQYWAEVVPQQIFFIDPLSNPKYYNNTWYPWLGDSC